MTLENKLNSILMDLHKHNRNRNDLIIDYISQRLNKSIVSYSRELEDNSHMLLASDNMYLLKRL